MEKEIKTSFTKEEIKEYIQELNKAKGNKRKVNKLLDVKHLPILVAYLRQIGVNEELLSLAAVVDFTRYKIRDVLTNHDIAYCIVNDTGIEFKTNKEFARPEKIGVDENGTFWLGNDKFFGRKYREINGQLWPVDSYMYLNRKMYYYKERDRGINRCGFAYCRFNLCGKFSVIDNIVKEENGMCYYTTEKTDIDGSESFEKRIYAGESINVDETESTLEEIYPMYITLFPKYKEWLDEAYLDGRSLEEKIRIIDSEIYRERLIKLGIKSFTSKVEIANEIDKYNENRKKLEDFSEFLRQYECETEDGKKVVSDILSTAEKSEQIDLEKIDFDYKKEQKESKLEDYSNMEYESLKEKAERAMEEYESLEDLLEELRRINGANSKLISKIEEKIRNICKVKKSKEEKEEKQDEEEIEI